MKKKHFLLALCLLLAAVAVAGCGDKTETPVTTLSLNPTELSVTQFDSAVIEASVSGGGEVTWSVSDPSVVQLTANGASATIVGLKAGEATVTAAAGDSSATCEVTVAAGTEVPVLSGVIESSSILVGNSLTLTPELRFKGETVEGEIRYASDDTSVLTVSDDGVVTGVTPGGPVTVTVTAVWLGYETSAHVSITVKENATFGLTSDVSVIYLSDPAEAGNPLTAQLTATVTENNEDISDTADVSYTVSSENGGAATVSDGVVTPTAEGTITVTAQWTTGLGTQMKAATDIEIRKGERTATGTSDVEKTLDTVTLDLSAYTGLPDTLPAEFTLKDMTAGSALTYTLDGKVLTLDKTELVSGERTFVIESADTRYLFSATVVNKVITTWDELKNLISYADDVADVTWTLADNWNLDPQTAKRYSGYFVLGDDIVIPSGENVNHWRDQSGQAWTGTDITSGDPTEAGLHGVFDGRGHTVTGGVYNRGGMFGFISSEGEIRNTAFVGATITDDNFTAVLASGFFGTCTDVLVDVTKNWIATTRSGGVFGYLLSDARLSDIVIYYKASSAANYNDGALASNIRDVATDMFDNVYVFTDGKTDSRENSYTGVTVSPLSTALAAAGVSGIDGTFWELSGTKAAFAPQREAAEELLATVEDSIEVAAGSSETLLSDATGWTLTAVGEAEGLTLSGVTVGVDEYLAADTTFTVRLTWNGTTVSKDITVSAKASQRLAVVNTYDYQRYTGLTASGDTYEKQANSADFVIDLTSAQFAGTAFTFTADDVLTFTLTGAGGEPQPLSGVVSDAEAQTFAIPAATAAALSGEYTLTVETTGRTLDIPLVIANRIFTDWDDLTKMVYYGDNVADVTWEFSENWNLSPQTAKRYDGYFLLGGEISAGTSTQVNHWREQSAQSWTEDAIVSGDPTEAGLHGVFDGRGYSISGGVYNRGGIFGFVSSEGEIRNIAFSDARITDDNFTCIIAAGFFGRCTNVLIDVSRNWIGRDRNGGVFGYLCADAVIEDTVIYYTASQYNDGAIAANVRGTNTLDNVYVFSDGALCSGGSVSGVTQYAFDTVLSAANVTGLDPALWDLAGDKAAFVAKN